ncbi:MAG: phosphoribosylformylglycinamidine synthase subunit PurQ [Nitrospinae bacterium]|nr:phosphoribosylformylglycinamidine synthase subunit PurQ [Nitrospinota bacterium]
MRTATTDKTPNFGVVVFPGSNCDMDVVRAASLVPGSSVRRVWHKDSSLGDVNVVILPGGFSYGDYLRCGAIARFSPVMRAVAEFAARGGPVLGICNGFQILVESGLLPGALLTNVSSKFICRDVRLRVERSDTPHTRSISPGTVLKMPVAHGDGNYYADPAVMERLEKNRQVVVRYCDENGAVTPASNPNGSTNNVAGVCNEGGNVFGLMPHPDRCSEAVLGGADGLKMFESYAL